MKTMKSKSNTVDAANYISSSETLSGQKRHKVKATATSNVFSQTLIYHNYDLKTVKFNNVYQTF